MVTTNFSNFIDAALSVAVQGDGKIVTAGQAFTGTGGGFALARYNIDGSLDTSFGVGGKVTTDFAGSNDQARSVAVQQDGKIRIHSSARSSFPSRAALLSSFSQAFRSGVTPSTSLPPSWR
ncbi:MAG: hypothetical protein MOB07_17865 [Acidobacteria bacterium]|nr:hypothetical protein [Acidobacteriota bacterium]